MVVQFPRGMLHHGRADRRRTARRDLTVRLGAQRHPDGQVRNVPEYIKQYRSSVDLQSGP